VIDLCEAGRIMKKVSDEGHSWETRDLSVAAERIREILEKEKARRLRQSVETP